MFVDMFGTSHRSKVLQPVVEGVAVLVVDDRPSGPWPIRKFPCDHSPRSPYIRLSHLHPCSALATSLPDSDRTEREPVPSGNTPELGCAGTTLPSFRRLQVPCSFSSTPVRAVIHVSQLGRFSMKRSTTNRANERSATRPRSSQCGPVRTAARFRAEQKPAHIARQAVRLHHHFSAAMATRRFDHAAKCTGSGTTLAVATARGRDAIGIDIDERNLDLARERIGMWLQEEEAAA